MDLDLNLFRGRPALPTQPVVVRELRREDFELLQSARGVEAKPIAKLRARHHTLARLLAQGTSVPDCQAITGYAQSRISILQGDPTFQELVRFYEGQVMEAYLDTHAKLGELTSDALDLIRERIEDEPDSVTMAQAIELVKLGADRTGHGPSSTQNTNINVNFAARLEEARKRVERMRTIEAAE